MTDLELAKECAEQIKQGIADANRRITEPGVMILWPIHLTVVRNGESKTWPFCDLVEHGEP